MHADDIRLRRMAVFGVLISNARLQRRSHPSIPASTVVYGSTMNCVCTSSKLRTALWRPASRLTTNSAGGYAGLADALGGPLAEALAGESPAEIGALRRRAGPAGDARAGGHRPIPTTGVLVDDVECRGCERSGTHVDESRSAEGGQALPASRPTGPVLFESQPTAARCRAARSSTA